LVCIKAVDQSNPSFYISKDKKFKQNYIQHYEARATMALQPLALMTSYLFSAWISHFVESIWRLGNISYDHHHLLILDGHESQMTLEVARAAMEVELDLLSLHSHISHVFQSLDIVIFESFEKYFHDYRDF
jgi:hypothetical protein